jgi:large subunit ribosomal protein L25
MEKILVKADKRAEKGKGGARSLRRQGVLPAVVYGEGSESSPIKVESRQMEKLIMSGVGEHALITIEMKDKKGKKGEHPVLVKDYQIDPVTDELLHVDFIKVSLKKVVKVTVPLFMTKEPVGVKMGGILQNLIREIEVECLPTQIPDKIEFDAESIDIGNSIHVSDVTPPEGVKIITDLAAVILTVSAPKIEEEVVEAEEEGAEPELVKGKGKEEEEGEEQSKPEQEAKEK